MIPFSWDNQFGISVAGLNHHSIWWATLPKQFSLLWDLSTIESVGLEGDWQGTLWRKLRFSKVEEVFAEAGK